MGFINTTFSKNTRKGNHDRGRYPGNPVRRFLIPSALLIATTSFLTLSSGCSQGGDKSAGGSSAAAAAAPGGLNLPSVANLNRGAEFFDAAEKLVDMVSRPTDKAAVLATIAEQRRKANDDAGAKQSLAALIKFSSTLPANDIATTQVILPLVAGAQAKVGDVAGAQKTASSIPDENGQSDAWSRVVIGQAESGDLNGAIATIGRAKFINAAHQYAALGAIATQAAIAGDKRGADLVSKNVEIHWRPKVYSDVAAALKKRGQNDAAQAMIQKAIGAVDTIRDKKNPSYENANRAEALIAVASVQTAWKDTAAARKTLQKAYQYAGKIGVDFPNASYDMRNDICGRLVTSLLLAGDTKLAQQAAALIKDTTMRDAYLDSVKSNNPIVTPEMENNTGGENEPAAVTKARSGDVAGAKEAVEKVQQPAQRAMLLAQVGGALK